MSRTVSAGWDLCGDACSWFRRRTVTEMARDKLDEAQRELFSAELDLLRQQHEVETLKKLVQHLQRQAPAS